MTEASSDASSDATAASRSAAGECAPLGRRGLFTAGAAAVVGASVAAAATA